MSYELSVHYTEYNNIEPPEQISISRVVYRHSEKKNIESRGINLSKQYPGTLFSYIYSYSYSEGKKYKSQAWFLDGQRLTVMPTVEQKQVARIEEHGLHDSGWVLLNTGYSTPLAAIEELTGHYGIGSSYLWHNVMVDGQVIGTYNDRKKSSIEAFNAAMEVAKKQRAYEAKFLLSDQASRALKAELKEIDFRDLRHDDWSRVIKHFQNLQEDLKVLQSAVVEDSKNWWALSNAIADMDTVLTDLGELTNE